MFELEVTQSGTQTKEERTSLSLISIEKPLFVNLFNQNKRILHFFSYIRIYFYFEFKIK